MGKKHFIGMGGLHECLPNTCDVYTSPAAAAESLGFVYDLSKRKIAELRRYWYLDLGSEVLEITECECDEPLIHSDSGMFMEED